MLSAIDNFFRSVDNLTIIALILTMLLISTLLIVVYLTYRYRMKEKRLEKAQKLLTLLFFDCVTDKIEYHRDLFNPKWLEFPTVVPVMENVNDKIAGGYWTHLKSSIYHDFFKTKITVHLQSKKWIDRHVALRMLLLANDISREEEVKPLLEDTVPLVRLQAVQYVLLIESEELINLIIDRLTVEQSFSYANIISLLKEAPSSVYEIVRKRLLSEKIGAVRVVCLEILSAKTGFGNEALIREDLLSENLDRKWWALRLLATHPSQSSIDQLLFACSDHRWQVRSLACQLLGSLMERRGFDSFCKMLADYHWYVRLSAALSLRALGEDGVRILQMQDLDLNPKSYNASQYVLNLPTEFDIQHFALTSPSGIYSWES